MGSFGHSRMANGSRSAPRRVGVIESDDGRIYLDYDDRYREYFEKYLDARQRDELTARLGFTPGLAVHVHASQAYQSSRELARSVCEGLATRWGGSWTE